LRSGRCDSNVSTMFRNICTSPTLTAWSHTKVGDSAELQSAARADGSDFGGTLLSPNNLTDQPRR
ncbi:MAG TPA: hypothetical protein VM260_27770, partial [Pirellula sp.]|nr:hypothetical protein [Pirellula sp.]